MVTFANWILSSEFKLLAAEQAAQPLLQRLEPSRRVAVLMALLGIIIVGIFFVAIALLGGNWARRLARHSPSRKKFREKRDLTRRESPPDPAELPESDDTIQIDRRSQHTKIDPRSI